MPTGTKNKYRYARDADMPGTTVLLAERKVEDHLSIVIAEDDRQYVRWWFNHQTGGFFWGDYHSKAHTSYCLACKNVWESFNETVERHNQL